MARIRSIKPEFFRHELLQDIEEANPKLRPMLVFAGLFTQCDKNGVFLWRPRHLKLDILPFLNFDLGASLLLLRENGFVKLMVHEGKEYGYIPSFREHQRISGKEAQDDSKYPQPPEMVEDASQGSVGEAPGKHPVAPGREGKRKGNGKGKGTAVYSQAFETFWAEYPKKVNKTDANREWEFLSPPDVLQETMLAALRRQKQSTGWLEEDGKYIPHPERWIKKRRWEDKVEVKKEDAGGRDEDEKYGSFWA